MRRRGPVFVALPIDVLELETSVEAIVPASCTRRDGGCTLAEISRMAAEQRDLLGLRPSEADLTFAALYYFLPGVLLVLMGGDDVGMGGLVEAGTVAWSCDISFFA